MSGGTDDGLVTKVAPVVRAGGKSMLRGYGLATASRRDLPDFLIIGTKRGGTTSLWNYLLRHPLVLPMFPARQHLKSNAYFFENRHRGLRWYRSHFATRAQHRRLAQRSGHDPVTGEASPYYMYDPRVLGHVRTALPDVKVIIQLRDPVKRAYSHYQERVNAGVEQLSFERALASEASRLEGERERMQRDPYYYSRPHDWYTYRDRGVYLPQVVPWLEAFPQDQVLVMRSEDLYEDPQTAFTSVTTFLGLPPHPMPEPRRHNFRPAAPMVSAVERDLRTFYHPHNLALYELLDRDMAWGAPAGA